MSSRGTSAPADPPTRSPLGRRACRAFVATTASVPGVRRWMRECLDRARVDGEARGRAELLISELVTNAVQHARGGRIMVSVRAGGGVVAGVQDEDPTLPLVRDAEPWESCGRGLALVAALSDDWGYYPAEAGKWVWFRVGRPRPAPGWGDAPQHRRPPPAHAG